jgi:hypothetical protein
LIAKEGQQGRGRDHNVVRFHEGAGYIAPRIYLAVSVNKGRGGVEGRGNLVTLDVHADKTVGVIGYAG